MRLNREPCIVGAVSIQRSIFTIQPESARINLSGLTYHFAHQYITRIAKFMGSKIRTANKVCRHYARIHLLIVILVMTIMMSTLASATWLGQTFRRKITDIFYSRHLFMVTWILFLVMSWRVNDNQTMYRL